MTDPTDEALSLPDVKQRFVDAQQRLDQIAEAAAGIEGSNRQLTGASDAIIAATGTLTSLAKRLSDVSGEVAKATESLQRIDPAAIRDGLDNLANKSAAHDHALARLRLMAYAILALVIIVGALVAVGVGNP